LVVLSYRLAHGEEAVFATLLSFPQDIAIRFVMILVIEAVMVMPCYYLWVCCFLCLCFNRERRSDGNRGIEVANLPKGPRLTVKIDGDLPMCTFGKNGRVMSTTRDGRFVGLRVGLRVISINGKEISGGEDLRMKLKRALAIASTYEVLLEEDEIEANSMKSRENSNEQDSKSHLGAQRSKVDAKKSLAPPRPRDPLWETRAKRLDARSRGRAFQLKLAPLKQGRPFNKKSLQESKTDFGDSHDYYCEPSNYSDDSIPSEPGTQRQLSSQDVIYNQAGNVIWRATRLLKRGESISKAASSQNSWL